MPHICVVFHFSNFDEQGKSCLWWPFFKWGNWTPKKQSLVFNPPARWPGLNLLLSVLLCSPLTGKARVPRPPQTSKPESWGEDWARIFLKLPERFPYVASYAGWSMQCSKEHHVASPPGSDYLWSPEHLSGAQHQEDPMPVILKSELGHAPDHLQWGVTFKCPWGSTTSSSMQFLKMRSH